MADNANRARMPLAPPKHSFEALPKMDEGGSPMNRLQQAQQPQQQHAPLPPRKFQQSGFVPFDGSDSIFNASTGTHDIRPKKTESESFCKKQLTSYEVYTILPSNDDDGKDSKGSKENRGSKDSRDKKKDNRSGLSSKDGTDEDDSKSEKRERWAKIIVNQESYPTEQIIKAIQWLDAGKLSIGEKKARLLPNQSEQVTDTLYNKTMFEREGRIFKWVLAQLHCEESTNLKTGKKETTSITIYLRRLPRRGIDVIQLYRERQERARLQDLHRQTQILQEQHQQQQQAQAQHQQQQQIGGGQFMSQNNKGVYQQQQLKGDPSSKPVKNKNAPAGVKIVHDHRPGTPSSNKPPRGGKVASNKIRMMDDLDYSSIDSSDSGSDSNFSHYDSDSTPHTSSSSRSGERKDPRAHLPLERSHEGRRSSYDRGDDFVVVERPKRRQSVSYAPDVPRLDRQRSGRINGYGQPRPRIGAVGFDNEAFAAGVAAGTRAAAISQLAVHFAVAPPQRLISNIEREAIDNTLSGEQRRLKAADIMRLDRLRRPRTLYERELRSVGGRRYSPPLRRYLDEDKDRLYQDEPMSPSVSSISSGPSVFSMSSGPSVSSMSSGPLPRGRSGRWSPGLRRRSTGYDYPLREGLQRIPVDDDREVDYARNPLQPMMEPRRRHSVRWSPELRRSSTEYDYPLRGGLQRIPVHEDRMVKYVRNPNPNIVQPLAQYIVPLQRMISNIERVADDDARSREVTTSTSVIATFRLNPRIKQSFYGLQLLIRGIMADMARRFGVGQVYQLPKSTPYSPQLQTEIQDSIVQLVDGRYRFILAWLHVDLLRGRPTKNAIRSIPKTIPLGSLARSKAYISAIKIIEDSDSSIPVMSWDMATGYISLDLKQMLEWCKDSNTNSIGSLQSRVTLIPSLDPTDVGGAAEEFAEILWDSDDIQRCVILGFMVMDANRFERNFLQFIRGYASELRAEADSTVQKSATHIVYYYGAYISRIIRRRALRVKSQATAFHSIKERSATRQTLERFLEQHYTKNPDQADTRLKHIQESSGNVHSDAEDPYLPNLEKLTDFLISSTAFKTFRTQLEVFVESNSRLKQSLEGLSSQSHIEKLDEYVPTEKVGNLGFLKRTKHFLQRSFRQPIPSGSQRVEWTCGCGDLLYMDFDSNSSRSFLTINALLCSLSATSQQPSGGSHAPSRPQTGAICSPTPVYLRGGSSQSSMTQPGPAPGQHSSDTPQEALIGISSTASTTITPSNSKFLELCVNSGELKTLGEIDVSSIENDGDFFSTVKAHYLRLRSFRSRFWLLKPVNVSYVRFSVEDRYRVGILHKPVALPPRIEVDEKRYHYDPCPLNNELPISSDLFLHYLFSCSAPSRNLIWLHRIPRKLHHSIFASTAPASFGWGVHINEGPDYLKVFMLNLVILGVSGVAALLWDIYRHDFQGAMGFAAWIIMLLNTLMAVFIAKWSQE
ncbi:hypothetical protein V497_05874 [Pseudogymnoascus sp. VKM F-4516 (FW-969)]|nr:hypothetical protein V497_05874 [Pseudogymnoascus sp. VKM F-4516 (FW-969)]